MKKILFLSLVLFSLFGCSKQVPITNATLNPTQIQDIMMSVNVGTMNYVVGSSTYELPSREFIEKDFSSGLKSFFNNFNFIYSRGDQDCRSFTLGSLFYIDYLHHNTITNKVSNANIAFGEFYYVKEGANGGGHAINVAITKEKEKYIVLFYEPQLCSIVQLSQTEIESCEFYRF